MTSPKPAGSAAPGARYLLICYDRKRARCASRREIAESWRYLKRRTKQLGLTLPHGLLRVRTRCLDVCRQGPIVVVLPDGVWYARATPEAIERILQEHVLGGRPVPSLRLADPPLPDDAGRDRSGS